MILKNGFITTQSDLEQHNGKTFVVVRALTEYEADIHDVGNMYKIQLSTGEIIDCFEDEIYDREKGGENE